MTGRRNKVSALSLRKDETVRSMLAGGATYQSVADVLGCTRQAVENRAKRIGVRGIQKAVRRSERLGCYLVGLDSTKGVTPKAIEAYERQRYGAAHRSIAWEFTFPSWWAVWRASGKWGERGQGGDAYCMARFGDKGAYAPGNVKIITNRENITESPDNRVDLLKGWSHEKRVKSRPFFARVRGEVIGRFETPEQARAAYEAAMAKKKICNAGVFL